MSARLWAPPRGMKGENESEREVVVHGSHAIQAHTHLLAEKESGGRGREGTGLLPLTAHC